MAWKDREGRSLPDDTENRTLRFLYETVPGRALVSILIHPVVSRMAGAVMDSRISKAAIPSFIKKNKIDMSDYEKRTYTSFNDFFTRKVKEGARPVDRNPMHLIAPCDSKLSVFEITPDAKFFVKDSLYTMEQLVRDKKLAAEYQGGTLLLFRLTVSDYHRYCYIESGRKSENRRIPGVFYTVNPIANEHYPIYKENTREFTLIDTEAFGQVLQMEVGATMVGRITNYHGAGAVMRGQEKGKFEFGGSTVIVCLKKGMVRMDEDLIQNSSQDIETVVKLGERIGVKEGL